MIGSNQNNILDKTLSLCYLILSTKTWLYGCYRISVAASTNLQISFATVVKVVTTKPQNILSVPFFSNCISTAE